MYIWNGRALARALREDAVTEAEKFKYVLAGAVLTFLIGGGGWYGWLADEKGALLFIGYVTIIAVGIRGCYVTNQVGDDRRFVERYVCLSFPVLVRWIVLSYALYYGAYALNYVLDGELANAVRVDPGWLRLLFALAMQLVFFVWLRRWISEAAQAERPTTPMVEAGG